MKSSFALAVLLAGYVAAQSPASSPAPPTSTGAVPTCVLTCSADAAQKANCKGVTDLPCVCTSTSFRDMATSCLKSNCSAQELQQGLQLQQQFCASANTSTGSHTGSSTLSTTSSASRAGNSATSPTSTSPTHSNAAATPAGFSYAAHSAWAVAAFGGAVFAQLAL